MGGYYVSTAKITMTLASGSADYIWKYPVWITGLYGLYIRGIVHACGEEKKRIAYCWFSEKK